MFNNSGHKIVENSFTILKKERDQVVYFEINDLLLAAENKNTNTQLTVEDPCFIIYGFEQSYYHIFMDAIPQLLLLRDTLKEDIKLYIYFAETIEGLIVKPMDAYNGKLVNRFVKILEEQGITTKIFCVGDYKTILFKKVFFINSRMLTFFHEIFQNHVFDQTSEEGGYLPRYVETIRKHFGSFVNINNVPNKKIYISRKLHSKKLREEIINIKNLADKKYIKILKDKILYGEEFDKDVELQKDGTSSRYINQVVQTAFYDVLSRHISEEDEDKIEKFFYDNGYEILEFSDIDFYSQIGLLSMCSHLATLSGSNLVNTIFLPDDANVFVINNNSNYAFGHNQYMDYRLKNIKYIFPYKEDDTIERYSAEQIIDFIKQNYMELI